MRNLAFACAVSAFALMAVPAIAADAPSVVRQILMQKDVGNGQTLTLINETIPVGGREGLHTHPGAVMVYVTSGTFTMTFEGKPTGTYKPGETFFVDANQVHEGINMGKDDIHAIAAFVTPNGQPLTVPKK